MHRCGIIKSALILLMHGTNMKICATMFITFTSPKIFHMVLYFLFFLHQMPIILLNKFNVMTLQRIRTVFSMRYKLKCVIQ
jgi:hypothetical protein